MAETCPTCGKPLEDEPDRLAAALARSGPNAVKGDVRNVYKTRDGALAIHSEQSMTLR